MMRSRATVFLLFLSFSAFCQFHFENYFQRQAAKQLHGKTEVIYPGKVRIDIITDSMSFEVEFASKWSQSVGQCLYYGIVSNLKPAVILIIRKHSDEKYLTRLLLLAPVCRFSVYTINKVDFKVKLIYSS